VPEPGSHRALSAVTLDDEGFSAAPVASLLQRGPVTLAAASTVQQAAQHMRAAGVSSLLITEGEDGAGRLLGVLTDRDLRSRVLAEGLPASTPVLQVATRELRTVGASASVFELMHLMARHGIHHVPVLDESSGRPLGVVSANRLNELHASSPLSLARRIHQQSGLEGLVEIAGQLGRLQRQLAQVPVSAHATGRIMSSITDAITVRLIELAQSRLGPAPMGFCWVAAGSQARMEQTARTDQDNCLLLDDAFDEARHGAYFEALARFVCDGLNACGYVYCPGEMMAQTPAWRQPLREWIAYFERWTRQPEPKALMLTCVFFDQRAVHGDAQLLQTLRREVLTRTNGNSIFLALMAQNALSHEPALGLFSRLSPSRSGEHAGSIDLKHKGIVPIVDLARIYALAAGIAAVGTQERLLAVGQGGEISAASAGELRQALEFIASLRLRHQARQLAAGQTPDNHLRPDEELSHFERRQLIEAFGIVQTLQKVLGQRYAAGRF
jgi:CBS domain-containing protein